MALPGNSLRHKHEAPALFQPFLSWGPCSLAIHLPSDVEGPERADKRCGWHDGREMEDREPPQDETMPSPATTWGLPVCNLERIVRSGMRALGCQETDSSTKRYGRSPRRGDSQSLRESQAKAQGEARKSGPWTCNGKDKGRDS